MTLAIMNLRRNYFRWTGLAMLAMALSGCGKSDPAFFRSNLIEMRPLEHKQKQDIADAVEAMFGTPDQPVVLKELADIGIKEENIRWAAGPVRTDEDHVERGLYRKHCSHCHGVTGDGAGPTAAFLNPYPRDFRKGVFKFKTTVPNSPPSKADLARILEEGIPGTAMPSFKVLLTKKEAEAILDYVRYLSIRGQTESRLIVQSQQESLETTRDVLIGDMLMPAVGRWKEPTLVKVDPPKEEVSHEASVKLGRALFYGEGGKLECVKCHGNAAMGDGGQVIYDDWTKKDADLKPGEESLDLADGGLPRRPLPPRNLRQGVYRGGRRPIDIYCRIVAGIKGTPMPEKPATLTSDEAWHVVNYVLSMPYEAFSENPQPKSMGHVATPK